ncbi:GSCOCG00003748001-RA-CDS [Cotesia congregata]|nr:GSCOCG00003748001-RA-CDS [Cotesia congregata]
MSLNLTAHRFLISAARNPRVTASLLFWQPPSLAAYWGIIKYTKRVPRVQQMAKIQNVQWIPNALFIARKLRPTSVAKAAPTKIPLPTAVPLTFVGNNSPRRT